ncbi:unnamed protein product [Nyctereutes procyonoides]|uniref:(raccoon dog) hypothetical protein n=1 Tax=Nyctereutes procyonoides TaxID=34880 RepID=A0A811Y6K1_NYCPR|nr:unnamed protein product [Nyctereutes procyonoides]
MADGVGEDLACSYIVPGVSSTYRWILDAAQGCLLDSWKRGGKLRGLRTQETLLKLASQKSGVEVVVGEAPWPPHWPDPCCHGILPTLGRLLAGCKLEQVLEQSHQLPASPTSMSQYHHSPKRGARLQEATEVEIDLEEAEGLCHLEQLCLVLEQMARLQHLSLTASPPPFRPLGSEVHRLLSHTLEIASPLKIGTPAEPAVPSANPHRLLETPAEPAYIFPSFHGHKQDLSHWNKVRVLLNWIYWRNLRYFEPPAPPDGLAPRIESSGTPKRHPCQPFWKAFMPLFVVKKQ